MKVKAKETTVFEGKRFEAGKVYNVGKNTYLALGPSVEKMDDKEDEKTDEKEHEKIAEDEKNTMMSDKEVKKK